MLRVLFVCVHNSARSQMAEAFLNKLGEGYFIAESAGLEMAPLNPLVVESMKEIGYDISENSTNSVFEYFKQGKEYSLIIKVCDQINGQKCPVFPMALKTISWDIEDPSKVEGSKEEKLIIIRLIRNEIKKRVEALIEEYKEYSKERK